MDQAKQLPASVNAHTHTMTCESNTIQCKADIFMNHAHTHTLTHTPQSEPISLLAYPASGANDVREGQGLNATVVEHLPMLTIAKHLRMRISQLEVKRGRA